MNDQTSRFSLDELCALTDTPRRTVRYYIQVGLVDRPHGAKRGAYYTRKHLEQLLEIRKWQRAGLSLDRIRELVAEPVDASAVPPGRPRQPGDVAVWSRVLLAPGVELHIEPAEARLSPEQVRALARETMELIQRITGGNSP